MLNTHPVDTLAAYPRSDEEATAQSMWRHAAARCLFNCAAAWIHQAHKDPRYHLAVTTAGGEYATALLLRALLKHAPQAADEVARDLYQAQEAGDALQEWSAQWLAETGIDPEQVYRLGEQYAHPAGHP